LALPRPVDTGLLGGLGQHRTLEAVQRDFRNPSLEGRRLFAEGFGTFLLVMVGAGGAVVSALAPGQIPAVARTTAPGLMVMAIILSMGATSGAHLNPAVSVAFAARGDFPWKRVPGYIIAQLIGATLACATLDLIFGHAGSLGATGPGPAFTDAQALGIEILLTMGLVTVILGTASKAQSVGPLAALGVSGYIILAGIWADAVSGAVMNPARALGPALVLGNFAHVWVYIVGPVVGALIAVGIAYILRGPGGDQPAIDAAQGTLPAILEESEKQAKAHTQAKPGGDAPASSGSR
jgi:aquaporin Z